MDFRIRQLEYFLVLAEKLNFRRAAFALGIAQPTLSFQIKSLEASFGVPLFDRTQREVCLTPEGERLRDHAKAIVNHARMALSAVHENALETLTVACGPVGQYSVLPALLREFAARRLNISLQVRSMSPEKMKQAAASGDVDLLLMTPDWSLLGMTFEGLRADWLSAVLPERHPAARRGYISVAEFCSDPVLVMAAADCHKHRSFVTGLMSRHGSEAKVVEVPFADGIHFAMVAAGRGVALAAGSIASANFPGIRIVPFDRPLQNMELGMMWHKGNHSRGLAQFLQMVRDVIAMQDSEALAPLPRIESTSVAAASA